MIKSGFMLFVQLSGAVRDPPYEYCVDVDQCVAIAQLDRADYRQVASPTEEKATSRPSNPVRTRPSAHEPHFMLKDPRTFLKRSRSFTSPRRTEHTLAFNPLDGRAGSIDHKHDAEHTIVAVHVLGAGSCFLDGGVLRPRFGMLDAVPWRMMA